MKKILSIAFVFFCWCNIGLTADIYYNEKLKRIYILGGTIELNDHLTIKKYANEGGESLFISSPGGYGWPEIGSLVRKKKLPVFVGRHCYSACTIITLSSPTLYASEDSMFMFHDPRIKNLQEKQTQQQLLTNEYRKAGATKEFIDLIKDARKKDTSTLDLDWEFWLRCDDVKKYFTKNQIFCDADSSKEEIKFIVENNSNIKNIYCSNNNKKQLIKLFFQPRCPEGINWKEIEKNKFESLKENFDIIAEVDERLVYNYDFGKIDMLIYEIGKLSESGINFDWDEQAKKYGFKSFKDAVNKYKKKRKVKINVQQAKMVFEKVDVNFKVDYSQKNLDKLYYLIFNDKSFLKWQKKKNSYTKTFKSGKWGKEKLHQMTLAVYINFEKEMAKITKNPNIDQITPFTWDWNVAFGTGQYKTLKPSYAIELCNKSAIKYKLIGGNCIIVDRRDVDTGEIKNMLKSTQQ